MITLKILPDIRVMGGGGGFIEIDLLIAHRKLYKWSNILKVIKTYSIIHMN